MKQSHIVQALLFTLCWPLTASANVILPDLMILYGFNASYGFIPIIFLEAAIVQHLLKALRVPSFKFTKLLGIIALANLCSSIVGFLISLNALQTYDHFLSTLPLAFAGSILLEAFVLIPFFKSTRLSFLSSTAMNFASYLLITILYWVVG